MIRFVVDADIPYIRGRLEPFGEVVYLKQDEIGREAVADADALLVRTRTRCGAPLLEGSRVQLVATGTIGTDHLDLPWLSAAGITACNAPGCNAPGVAQYVWSNLLHEGIRPAAITLGVIGHGNVGRIVAEWGRAMGANVLLNDPPRSERGEQGYTDLDTLLRQSDIVTLHVPLTHEGKHATHHLVGSRELSLMRKGSWIVNAARGGVVDESALRPLLSSGEISAIIDTWEGEPDINPDTLRLARVASQHIAGYSDKGKQRATRMLLEAVARKFGITPDLSGLEGAYIPIPENTDADSVMAAINATWHAPAYANHADMLGREAFDRARAAYRLAAEPDFGSATAQ